MKTMLKTKIYNRKHDVDHDEICDENHDAEYVEICDENHDEFIDEK